MDEHMQLDTYNKNHKPYMIANIYFDTEFDYLIRKSLSKPEYKEKLLRFIRAALSLIRLQLSHMCSYRCAPLQGC